MDPYAQATLLVCVLGVLIVMSLIWRFRSSITKRSAKTPDRAAVRDRAASADEDMTPRARDMRARDIERVLQRALDDVFRPV